MGEAVTYDNYEKEQCIQVHLKRSALGSVEKENMFGLTVNVQAHPRVEAFFKELADDIVSPNTIAGRGWFAVDNKPLKAYINHTSSLEQLRCDQGMLINLDRLGAPLIETSSSSGEEVLNLSFLRLVGISEEGGVTFHLKSVYSLQGLFRLRDLIQNAQNKVYNSYLRPVHLSVTTTQQRY
jgi:hypothetical protein